ncbi:MAG: ATP-dependent zinc metalloprotease FtsH [Waddliaceae bacterium]|mgnify:CR=1 FL=1|nr:ATP-dependent zinc metalloprotease FtsH [Waddliaceae bacterium]MBT7264801.1 ATP-dependent zinc metalloprotease FtsH [Waddliaceae bacterium]
MAGEKKQDNKKNMPGGLLFFIIITILIVMVVQTSLGDKKANVAFSHQVEHLVNLELVQDDMSKKVAIGSDNLVTFSGKFREMTTEEGEKRFVYLKSLDIRHALADKNEMLSYDLDAYKEEAKKAAETFLMLIGRSTGKEGYTVVGDGYDTQGRDNSIIIEKLSDSENINLYDLRKEYPSIKKASQEKYKEFVEKVGALVANFRAPILGIGDEAIKEKLSALADDANNATTAEEHGNILDTLQDIATTIEISDNGVRLYALRSVRSYVDVLKDFTLIAIDIADNAEKLAKTRDDVDDVVWFFNDDELSTRALERQDPDEYKRWFANAEEEWNEFDTNMGAIFKAPDQARNIVLDKKFKSEPPAPNYFSYIFTVLPIVLVLLLLYFVFARQMKGGMGGGAGGAMSFGKSPAKLLTKDDNKVTFVDVAGIEEAKEELEEIVEFLKNPGKFTSLGGRIPKGVLCIGAPGTGKTLIAKAVAGEADRPFFSISGSDFVEMFVGVGASRIRDMFAQAKKNAPCIVFIDEIDAVGRHRGSGIGGGHDEREQTLNQLLVEMDGFNTGEGVIIMAATNRPDVLDKALLRPGRFDRTIYIDLPDIKGRYEILKVHARKIKLDPELDLMILARATPGSSGADLENMLNEAALLAARKGRKAVTQQETTEAVDKVRFGKERRSLELDEEEKKTTAYHESGHAIVGLTVEHADPIEKVTIIPRGPSLGATHFLPKKNRVSYWKKELTDQLAVFMGGRVAEELFLGDISSGAQQDIKEATRLAHNMVCSWGMSDEMGAISYADNMQESKYMGIPGSYQKHYSEVSAQKIDNEVRKIIEASYDRAKKIIKSNKTQLELMAQMLIEFETVDAEDCKKILDGTWDSKEKEGRLKKAAELHKGPKPPTPPPPPKDDEKKDEENPEKEEQK